MVFRRHSATLLTSVIGFILVVFAFAFAIALNLSILWVMASTITSGVKAVSDKCGTVYGIEKTYIRGDWFCAESKVKE